MNDIMVTRSSLPSFDEFVEEIRTIWDTYRLTNMGEKHQKLEAKLREYLQVDSISLMCNGHMSLELGLQALNLDGEVITSPFTFASTTHAIVRNNLTPVFCDIKEDDYTIDVNKIEQLITDRTVAIVPIHVYGNVCDVEEIDRIAKKYGLKVLYDAAHAFGESYKGKGIGTFGDMSVFSFHATKVFHTIEGGAICFHDSEYGKLLYQLKNFGIKSEETVDGVGANAKMNEFQAAMGICNLRHIDEEIRKRKVLYTMYLEELEGLKGIILPRVQDKVKSNYSYFPVYFNEKEYGRTRNEIASILAQNHIFSRKYFYPITSMFDCYRGRINSGNTPVALNVSKHILTLPLYPDLSQEDVRMICKIIRANSNNM